MEQMEVTELVQVEGIKCEEIIDSESIELSEAEVHEVAATVIAAAEGTGNVTSVQCLLTTTSATSSADHHHHHHGTAIKPGSELPAQILSTEEVEEESSSGMIIDEANNTITFQRILGPATTTTSSEITTEDGSSSTDRTVQVGLETVNHFDDADGRTQKVVLLRFEPIKDFTNCNEKGDKTPEGVNNDTEEIIVIEKSKETEDGTAKVSPSLSSKENGSSVVSSNNNIHLPFSFPGQSFNEQAQKLILNVWDFFKRAKKDPSLVSNLRGPQDHAAAALNVGTKTIGKIAKRVLRLGKLETPGKKRNRPKTVLDSIGSDEEEILRTIIREMYDKRVAPTIPLVLAEAKTRLNFKGSTTSLRRVLKRMGYRYGGIDNSLIQSDKSNVSGWKERTSKKSKTSLNRPSSSQAKRKSTPNKKKSEEATTTTTVVTPVPQVVEADGIIQAHETCQQELIQPHEVIIHYQKSDDSFISQGGHHHHHQSEILMTTDPTQIIQLQLESNGETVPVTVVQEWQWPSGVDGTTTILGLKSL